LISRWQRTTYRALAALACMLIAANQEPGTSDARTSGQVVGTRFDIGKGRKIYLICSGPVHPRQPTIILISGYHDSSDPWTQSDVLSLLPQAVGPPVFEGLASRNHVCAYDRPGTIRYITNTPLTGRSTPVAQPRTAMDLVAELHSLLAIARVPGPYVLVAHSLAGLIAVLYARTYPDDVRGMVFVDSFSPAIPKRFGRLWPLYRGVLNPPPANQPLASLRLPTSEVVDIDASIAQIDRARPLRKMPLAVLTKTEPFRIAPGSLPTGITLGEIDDRYNGAQEYFVRLAPTTPQIFATGSEHYIQLSQPDLVTSATQLVIDRVSARHS